MATLFNAEKSLSVSIFARIWDRDTRNNIIRMKKEAISGDSEENPLSEIHLPSEFQDENSDSDSEYF